MPPPKKTWKGAHIHTKKNACSLLISWSILQNMNIVALFKVPQPGIAYLDKSKSKKMIYFEKKIMISRRQTQRHSCVEVCLPPTLTQSYKWSENS